MVSIGEVNLRRALLGVIHEGRPQNTVKIDPSPLSTFVHIDTPPLLRMSTIVIKYAVNMDIQ